ncbi:uncharacterized protein [Miscanthus floridulus]|uniref:uncharacterized protein n=1 Tax=Miscanthus floridulus TaxID=154761 RepID=UPI00345812B7
MPPWHLLPTGAHNVSPQRPTLELTVLPPPFIVLLRAEKERARQNCVSEVRRRKGGLDSGQGAAGSTRRGESAAERGRRGSRQGPPPGVSSGEKKPGSAAGRELGGEGAEGLPRLGRLRKAPAEAALEAVPRSRAHPSAIEEGRGGEEEEGGGGEGACGGGGATPSPTPASVRGCGVGGCGAPDPVLTRCCREPAAAEPAPSARGTPSEEPAAGGAGCRAAHAGGGREDDALLRPLLEK